MTQEQKIREIPNRFIKRLGFFDYSVKSVNPKNQGEVNYHVFYSTKTRIWYCDCKDYMFRNNEDNPEYRCKHIERVRNMILVSYIRQMKKQQRDLTQIPKLDPMTEKIDLGDVFN